MTASSSEIFKFYWNEKTGLRKILMIVFYSVLLYLINIIYWFIKWKKWYLNQERINIMPKRIKSRKKSKRIKSRKKSKRKRQRQKKKNKGHLRSVVHGS